MSDSDRPSALLTPAQRQFLDEDYGGENSAHDRAMLSRIRKRIRASIPDISLIVDTFDKAEFKKTFEDDVPIASDLVALAVLAEEHSPEYGTGVSGREPPDEPEATIVAGTRKAFEKLGMGLETIEVIIEAGKPLDELAGEELANLSDDELGQLFSSGRITRKQMSDALLEKDVQGLEGDNGAE